MSAIRDRIVALYGEGMLRKSILSIREGAGVMERVLGGGKFKTALEIGTYRGVGAAEMSQFCERVITIDLKQGRMERVGDKHDRHAFWKSLGVTNVELILVDDDRHKARVVEDLEFDFAFIDGAHDRTVRDDFELVKRCRTVLFHDIDRRGKPELDYVIDFFESLPKAQTQVFDIFGLWTDPSHG